MFENKLFEAVSVVLIAVSFAYFGIRTIHEWDNVKKKKWDSAEAKQVQMEYTKREVK